MGSSIIEKYFEMTPRRGTARLRVRFSWSAFHILSFTNKWIFPQTGGIMVRNILPACFCAGVLFSGAMGQNVDISGKVVDESAAAVAGASIVLMINGTATVTDNSGAYHLGSTSVRSASGACERSAIVSMNGKRLRIFCAAPERAAFDLFSLDGKRIPIAQSSLLSAGFHDLIMPLSGIPKPGSSCRILSVTLDGVQHNFKVVTLDDRFQSFEGTAAAAAPPQAPKSLATVIVDTMQIVKTGYDTVKVCLDKYIDTMPDVYLTAPAGYPRMIIDNAATVMTIYKPNAATGYYRGTRFDWSGIIGKVASGGHTWYADYTAGSHDPLSEGTGTAGEYGIDSATGYSGTQPFLKIGVGKLQATGGTYDFRTNYPIIDAGVWNIVRGKYWVEFTHLLTAFSGYDYDYVKRITLSDSTAVFTIAFDLKNSGTKSIVTDHYTHNFTLIDNKQVAGNYKVTFGFAPVLLGGSQTSSPGSWGSMATIAGGVLSITATLNGSDYLWASFGGLTGKVSDNSAIVQETTGKAALGIRGDAVPYKYNFWASPRSVCPEAYLLVKLDPGAEMSWTDTYTVYPNGVQ
jgi:hypothetical protein